MAMATNERKDNRKKKTSWASLAVFCVWTGACFFVVLSTVLWCIDDDQTLWFATALASASSVTAFDGANSKNALRVHGASTYQCAPHECQRDATDSSESPLCAQPVNGKCPAEYSEKAASSAESFEMRIVPDKADSIVDVSFSVTPKMIATAFVQSQRRQVLHSNAAWWIVVVLPTEWNWVVGQKSTVVEVTFQDVTRTLPTDNCATLGEKYQLAVCSEEGASRLAFVNVGGLLDWSSDQILQGTTPPIAVRFVGSIKSGGSDAHDPIGVMLVPSSASSIRELSQTRELDVSSDLSRPRLDLEVMPLASSLVLQESEPKIYSAIVWMEPAKNRLGFSFGASNVLANYPIDPKICIDLRALNCNFMGPSPDATLELQPGAAPHYIENPFLDLNPPPDEGALRVELANRGSAVCVKNLLGNSTKVTLPAKNTFQFQMRIKGIKWIPVANNGTAPVRDLPALVQISILVNNKIEARDCAQIMQLDETPAKQDLSVFSVMSITIYALALVGAVLITRMNGISFSDATFYNDMTSISVLVIFSLNIISNSIWINVSKVDKTTSGAVYYLLTQIVTCFTWTMMTSVCFHWTSVLSEGVQRIRRVYVKVVFLLLNLAYYAFNIFVLLRMFDFYKCAYRDYLTNPKYNLMMMKSEHPPDLQPRQWLRAVEEICHSVDSSNLLFPVAFINQLLILLTAVVLLMLGHRVLRRGMRLIEQSGDVFDDGIVQVMRRSLVTYLAVIFAISMTLAVSFLFNIVLFVCHDSVNEILWYVLTVWLPTVVPPAGFLILQWNPRLQGIHWDPTAHVKNPTRDSYDDVIGKSPKNEPLMGTDELEDLVSSSIRSVAPVIGENYNQGRDLNVLAISMQLACASEITEACYVELHVLESASGNYSDDEELEYPQRASTMQPRLSSISAVIQTGIQRDAWMQRRSLTTFNNHRGNSSRVGFTEAVLPVLREKADSDGASAYIARFMSVVQLPVSQPEANLRFVVHTVPDLFREDGSKPDKLVASRVSGLALAANCKPRVLCEFSCSVADLMRVEETELLAKETRSLLPHRASTDADGSSSMSMVLAPRLSIKAMTVSKRGTKDSRGSYTTASFQFTGENELVVEDLTETIFTNEIPCQYLELLRRERNDDLIAAKNDLRVFEEKFKNGLMGGLYDNLIDQIQGENDQNVVHAWLEQRVRLRNEYIVYLNDCYRTCIQRAREGLTFKASVDKKVDSVGFLPINLHVQDFWVGPMSEMRSQRSRRISTLVKSYPTVTVGAFAAHSLKFRHNGGILGLRNRINESDVSIDQQQPDWRQANVRQLDEMMWQLSTRLDICRSQALAAVVTAFCRNLELSLQHPTNKFFLDIIDSLGFLFQVESLLSTQGKEHGMLEDFFAATEEMRHVSFVLDFAPSPNMPLSLNVHMKSTDLPGVVAVKLSEGESRGSFLVTVTVRCGSTTLARVPQQLQEGKQVGVIPVMFTQGINEMQTLANNASQKKTSLQNTINQQSLTILTAYVYKFKQVAAQWPQESCPVSVDEVTQLLASLDKRITSASKQVVRTRHPKIIQEASKLCRLLGAGRVTSCKSAKDRTAMSVTLEQVHLLRDHHGLPAEAVVRTVSTLRSNGVRLQNALKNTGKRQYAFNALQRSMFPEEYRCPEGTYGRGNVS